MAAVRAGNKENAQANSQALSSGELKSMLGQCLKMASENKITSQNTWGLPLIEHLDDLIKEDDPNRHTNFQRASVTLDAGVKIYSYRVDSVHTETFKILGGLGRASGPVDEDGDPGEGGAGENVSPSKRKRRGHELNPEATLESSFEALNVKKFDLAFAVDPLFHKTSAQFDAGGSRGLLLNNLSVYRGCDIVFDSMDVPEAAADTATAASANAAARVDLDVVGPQLQAILTRDAIHARVSPTLDGILALVGAAPGASASAEADAFVRRIAQRGTRMAPAAAADECAAPPAASAPASPAEGGGNTEDADGVEIMDTAGAGEPAAAGEVPAYGAAPDDGYDDGDYGDYGGGGGYDDDDFDGNNGDAEGTAHQHQHGNGPMSADVSSALQDDALGWLIAAGGGGAQGSTSYVTASKGWAGASHWRYRAVGAKAGLEGVGEEGEDEEVDSNGAEGGKKTRGAGKRKKNDPLDFVALMAEGAAEPVFEMLPRGGGRRAAASRQAKPACAAAATLLPEDYHYTPEFLARYALRPRTAVALAPAGGGGAGASGPTFGDGDFGGFGGGFDDGDDDNGDSYGGEWGDFEFPAGDVADALEVAQASHKVDKVEVNYSRAAKQVDVRSLKELMWGGVQTVVERQGSAAPIEFADVLGTVPEMNAAGRLDDLSVHLCFICVLHLANEHGLVVEGVPELNKLRVSNVPVEA